MSAPFRRAKEAPLLDRANRGAIRCTPKTAPGPTGHDFLCILPGLVRDPLKCMLGLLGEYGDVVCVGHRRFQPIYLLSHPDHIKHVLQDNHLNYGKGKLYNAMKRLLGEGLVTSEGETWHRQRRFSQPAFRHQHDEEFGRVMVDATAAMLERWPARADEGRAFDVREEMRNLTLDILLKSLFSTNLESHAEKLCPALSTAEEEISLVSSLNPLHLQLKRLPTPANLRFKRALRTIDKFAYQLIDERRRSSHQYGDLLSLWLAPRENGEKLSDQLVRDAMITLVDSGYDSTAGAMTWTWYLLSRNPAVQRKLHAELSSVLGGSPARFEDLPKLPYTKMVVQETLRLYPSAWAIARVATKDDEIDGYFIPARSLIVISPYVAHRRPASWENPEGFDPERFSPERSNDRHRFSYFPFGGGPRLCLGSSFAMMEAQLVVATVAARWRLDLVPGPSIEPKPRISLRPEQIS